jgi:hypothetical protein
MATYCDPLAESWKDWHDADSWDTPEPRKTIDRFDLARIGAIRRADSQDSIAGRFARLVLTWKDETENLSSFTKVVQNSSYQQIIRLGKDNPRLIIPMILADLKGGGGHWSTALQAITGESPVKAEHIGNQKNIAADWLSWGRQSGYI